MPKIAVIGAGNMGSPIAAGLAKADYSVAVSNPSVAKLNALTSHPTISITTDNRQAAASAAVIFVATRPAITMEVISGIVPVLNPGTIVVTLAPNISIAELKAALPDHCYAGRIMPNIAISLGESMTFLCLEEGVQAAQLSFLKGALDKLGTCAIIPESLMGAGTALCSCGIAYALRYVRAATEGAVAMGIKPDDAVQYIAATLRGAAAMLSNCHANPESLIDKVTTPGGTTIRGLMAMEKAGFSNAVVSGLLASCHE